MRIMRDICWLLSVSVILFCLVKISLMHFTETQTRDENDYKRRLRELETMEDD